MREPQRYHLAMASFFTDHAVDGPMSRFFAQTPEMVHEALADEPNSYWWDGVNAADRRTP